MKRTLLLMGGGATLAVLMFALSHTGTAPVSKAQVPGSVPATVSLDIIMCDGAGPLNPQPHCAGSASTVANTNDDGIIEEGERPEIQTNLWIDVDWTDRSDQSFFDLASTYWTTGPAGPDQTGDGWEDPLSGIAASSADLATNPNRLGATIGEITFKISTNLTSTILLMNNVDDAPTNTDSTVMGQPPVCNSHQDPGDEEERLPLSDTFELWTATTCTSATVSHLDTDGDGCPQSQEDSTGPGADGDDCTLDGGPPNGVVMSPAPLTRILVDSGLPLSKYMGRSFGIARLDILGVASNDVDVNFLIFNMLQPLRRYAQITVVQYPGEASRAPEAGSKDDALAQTVVTCPPYWSSPVRVFGIAVDPDWDGDTVVEPHEAAVEDGWDHRVAMAQTCEVYDYGLDKSVDEDYDGDGIANPFDRCRTDPTCGTAAHDTDGDFLCGACDINGEGNNPGPYNTTVPWGPGQDVDQDGYLNQNDNCPTVPNGIGDPKPQADRDADTVGDACEPEIIGDGIGNDDGVCDPAERILGGCADNIPGDGTGYSSLLNDADNKCVDEFALGISEPAAEAGNPPGTAPPALGKYCMGPVTEVGLTTPGEPPAYTTGNPPLWACGNDPFRDASDDGMPDYEDFTASACPALPPLYDSDSDEDLDGHSDACEAAGPDGVEGGAGPGGADESDALDPTSTPGAPAVEGIPGVGGDCDGGGEWDYAEDHKQFPTDMFNAADDESPALSDLVDTDVDGCVDSEEMAGAAAPNPGATGNYNPFDPYDFYDVPIPAVPDPNPNGTRNQAVAMDDVLGVLFYVGTYAGDGGSPNANGVAYDVDKDGNTRKDGRDYDRDPSPAPNPPWDAGPPSGAVAMDDVLAVLAQTGLSCIGTPDVQLVDVEISNLVLTLNGVPQTPGSEVIVPRVASTILDVQLQEHVYDTVDHPVQVKEYVYIIGAPIGTYHCVNDDAAVTKDPSPLQKKWQECTVNGLIVPPSTLLDITCPWCDNEDILDVAVEWELLKSTTYTKTVNLIHVAEGPPPQPSGPYVWELDVTTMVPGSSFEAMVCAKEIPEPPARETDWSDNALCTPYTITVAP